jgi:hypothetical protein
MEFFYIQIELSAKFPQLAVVVLRVELYCKFGYEKILDCPRGQVYTGYGGRYRYNAQGLALALTLTQERSARARKAKDRCNCS